MRTAIPAVATGLLILIYLALPVQPPILGDKKYLDYLLQIVGILPGFYIAALAAAATFVNPALDEEITGKDAPQLDVKRGGETFHVTMTMRVFICHLFSYLSAMSFITSLLAIAIIELEPSVDGLRYVFSGNPQIAAALTIVSFLSVALVTFYFLRILVITMHGLYFLVERMHLDNR